MSKAADCFGQVSVLTVVAPPFPDTGPLRLIFDLDASEIPHGIHVADIAVYHNSIAVPDCAGAAGVAAPDPCVAGRLENKRTKDVESSKEKRPRTWKRTFYLNPDLQTAADRKLGCRMEN